MTTRYDSKGTANFGVPGLTSGYEGNNSDLFIPPVGIEDVDAALFALFDKEIAFEVSTSDKNREEIKKVPVIFASSEKWALAKKQRGIRDKNGSLILPLITIVRTTIQQTPNDDIVGRGINQQTGELIIARRFSKLDRGHQSLVNKLGIKTQKNIAVSPGDAESDQIATTRNIGELTDDPTFTEGGVLASNNRNNVFETIAIPTPQFYTSMFEITFWAQYQIQLNQMLERLISSFLPQAQSWKLNTKAGYWFIAMVDGNVYNSETNIDDMSSEERMMKYKFSIKVPAYILASKTPGSPIPVKRYISSPIVSFDVDVGSGAQGDDDPFLGSDDPTLPLENGKSSRDDQRRTGHTQLYPNSGRNSPNDPALGSLKRGQNQATYRTVNVTDAKGNVRKKHVRVSVTNRVGETVFSPDEDFGTLSLKVSSD